MDYVRRSGWGAGEPRGKPIAIPTPVRDLFLHHSVTPDNGPDTVRAIQRFHQDTRGWADIAYTVIYSPKHRVFFEGRGFGISGAHTRGHNRTAHGLCVLGNYDHAKPTRDLIDDLAEFLRWHAGAYGASRFRPHHDVGATACPGGNLTAVIADINLEAERDFTPPEPPGAYTEPADEPAPAWSFDDYKEQTREWIAERVEPTFGSYDAWSEAVRRFGDD